MADPRNLQQNRTPAFRSTGMFDDLIPEQNRQPRNPFDQFDEPRQPNPFDQFDRGLPRVPADCGRRLERTHQLDHGGVRLRQHAFGA